MKIFVVFPRPKKKFPQTWGEVIESDRIKKRTSAAAICA